jgi:hypothetical protein
MVLAADYSDDGVTSGRPRVCGWFIFFVVWAVCGAARAQEVNLLMMGDWGAGSWEQRQVADTMARYVEGSGKQFDGLFSTGDNFYSRISGVDDKQWRTLFEEMYDVRRLNFPFYMAVGNHDHDGDNLAVELAYGRVNPGSRWRLPARWYRVDLPAENPLVSVLVLESNKPKLTKRDWLEQIDWLERQLAGRRAPWTICIGHHPLHSNGGHGDNAILQRDWGELLEKHGVQFYGCGHDHALEHLQVEGRSTSFLVCGGGGANRAAMIRDSAGPFSRSVHGFAHLRLLSDRVIVRFISLDGEEVHHFERSSSGAIRLLATTGRDPVPLLTTRPSPPFSNQND